MTIGGVARMGVVALRTSHLRSSAAGYARLWGGTSKMDCRRQLPQKAARLRQEGAL